MTTQTHRSRVTVIGLGQMGTAVARVLTEAGHDTTVWNRTACKTEARSGAPPRLRPPLHRLARPRMSFSPC